MGKTLTNCLEEGGVKGKTFHHKANLEIYRVIGVRDGLKTHYRRVALLEVRSYGFPRWSEPRLYELADYLQDEETGVLSGVGSG